MKKTYQISLLFICLISNLNSQIKVANNGKVGIGTSNPTEQFHLFGQQFIDSYTPNWGSALYAKVHNQYSCAFNLGYGGRDVFYVVADGYLWTLKGGYFGSDINFKKNISPIKTPLETILKLNGVKYEFKDLVEKDSKENKEPEFRLGFIAQEVEKIVPEVVKTMSDNTKAIAYTDLIALVVEGMKEQQKQIIELKNIIENTANVKENQVNNNYAKLYNNIPNPFSIETEIRFDIPRDSKNAMIIIHDMQGSEIKNVVINEKGNSHITINSNELKPGLYYYSLIVNDEIIDTKKMILTKD